jgi:peptidyl-tRNA hydrolase
MLSLASQAKTISLTDFRKVISQTLNSEQLQIVSVKKGKKKVIVDLSLFEDMYQAYQHQQWQQNLEQLQDTLTPQVINDIGQEQYERINQLTDLDEVVATSSKLMNTKDKTSKYGTKHS